MLHIGSCVVTWQRAFPTFVPETLWFSQCCRRQESRCCCSYCLLPSFLFNRESFARCAPYRSEYFFVLPIRRTDKPLLRSYVSVKLDVQSELHRAIRARDAAAALLAHAQATNSHLLIAYELQLQSMQREVELLVMSLDDERRRDGVIDQQEPQVQGRKGMLYRVA
jgi:hypothetical protein